MAEGLDFVDEGDLAFGEAKMREVRFGEVVVAGGPPVGDLDFIVVDWAGEGEGGCENLDVWDYGIDFGVVSGEFVEDFLLGEESALFVEVREGDVLVCWVKAEGDPTLADVDTKRRLFEFFVLEDRIVRLFALRHFEGDPEKVAPSDAND